jgi:hypothetical protein
MQAEGWRAFVFGATTFALDGANTVMTVTIENKGDKAKGLTAEGLTAYLPVPKGYTVVKGAGGKYEGVKALEYVTNPGVMSPFRLMNPNPQIKKETGDIAVFKIAKLAPGAKEVLTLTLSGSGNVNVPGANLTWAKPVNKRVAGVKLIDDRITPPAGAGDIIYAQSLEWTVGPAPKPAAPAAK